MTMRSPYDAADHSKDPATPDAADQRGAPSPRDRGFGAFGAILISFVAALLGTTAVAVLFNVSWIWWLPIFIIFGVTSAAATIGMVYWKES